MFQTYHSKFNFFDCCMCVLLLLNDELKKMMSYTMVCFRTNCSIILSCVKKRYNKHQSYVTDQRKTEQSQEQTNKNTNSAKQKTQAKFSFLIHDLEDQFQFTKSFNYSLKIRAGIPSEMVSLILSDIIKNCSVMVYDSINRTNLFVPGIGFP